MKELLRTNDAVLISYIEALMTDAGIGVVVLDRHASILEGSIGAIPRRLMVGDDDLIGARAILRAARIDHDAG